MNSAARLAVGEFVLSSSERSRRRRFANQKNFRIQNNKDRDNISQLTVVKPFMIYYSALFNVLECLRTVL